MNDDDYQVTVKLPPGIHAEILAGRDIVTGGHLAYAIVWADRVGDTCPQCGQPVARVIDRCPVLLDTGAGQGGAIEEWSKQHGCGEWLSVDWFTAADTSGAAISLCAEALAVAHAEEIRDGRQKIRRRLERNLREALARLAEPLENGETAEDREHEVTTGGEVEPGVFREGSGWLAWDYDPAGDEEGITVRASDLAGS